MTKQHSTRERAQRLEKTTVPVLSDGPFLEAVGLGKKFGDHAALSDVSLEAKRGEVISLIGPSGAGKSTLLRCFNLLEIPTTGVVRIGNAAIDASEGSPSRASVLAVRQQAGMVFQSFNLFPHMTALRNISLPQQRVLGRSKAESEMRALALLERVGLAEKASSYPNQCSGGQQQRIAIARALALDPAVMLFDEPTSGLDPEVGAEILAVMKELAAGGMTMIIATHEMEFARNVCDRVMVMVDGRIIEEGDPHVIMSSPSQERTQEFLKAVVGR